MDACTIETGLLRKKPCGHPGVAHCENCERPLCAQHAHPHLNDAGKKSGKFLCKECEAAWKDIEKNPPPAVKKAAPAAPAEKPAPGHAAAPKSPAEAKPAEAKPAESSTIEFTPTKK